MAERLENPVVKQGWLRAVVFFILYVLLISGASSLLKKVLPGAGDADKNADTIGSSQSELLITYFLLTALTLGMIWLVRKIVDKQSFFSLGFAWKGYSHHAVVGGLAAVAMLGIGTLILILTGHLTYTDWDSSLKHLLFNILLMLLVALLEETIFRGYLLNNLLQSFNKWVALGVSTLLFTLIHAGNEGIGILPLIEIAVGGAMLGINYLFTRNLWFSIALHFAWNFLQGPVLGYEVSGLELPSILKQEISGPTWLTGGAFGFEGSVLAMVLNIGLIMLLIWHYNRQQIQPTAGFTT